VGADEGAEQGGVPLAAAVAADAGAVDACEIADLDAVCGLVPLGEAAELAEEADDMLGLLAGGEAVRIEGMVSSEGLGGAPEEEAAALVGGTGEVGGFEEAGLFDEECEDEVVAFGDAAVADGSEAVAVVGAAGGAADLVGGDEIIAFEGHEVLANGHGGEGEGGGEVIDGGAAGTLEGGEDLVLCGMHMVLFGRLQYISHRGL
jgi:hypothetical protein